MGLSWARKEVGIMGYYVARILEIGEILETENFRTIYKASILHARCHLSSDSSCHNVEVVFSKVDDIKEERNPINPVYLTYTYVNEQHIATLVIDRYGYALEFSDGRIYQIDWEENKDVLSVR